MVPRGENSLRNSHVKCDTLQTAKVSPQDGHTSQPMLNETRAIIVEQGNIKAFGIIAETNTSFKSSFSARVF